jgi:hypothetical protein
MFNMHRENYKLLKYFARIPLDKQIFVRSMERQMHNITLDSGEAGCEDVDCNEMMSDGGLM